MADSDVALTVPNGQVLHARLANGQGSIDSGDALSEVSKCCLLACSKETVMENASQFYGSAKNVEDCSCISMRDGMAHLDQVVPDSSDRPDDQSVPADNYCYRESLCEHEVNIGACLSVEREIFSEEGTVVLTCASGDEAASLLVEYGSNSFHQPQAGTGFVTHTDSVPGILKEEDPVQNESSALGQSAISDSSSIIGVVGNSVCQSVDFDKHGIGEDQLEVTYNNCLSIGYEMDSQDQLSLCKKVNTGQVGRENGKPVTKDVCPENLCYVSHCNIQEDAIRKPLDFLTLRQGPGLDFDKPSKEVNAQKDCDQFPLKNQLVHMESDFASSDCLGSFSQVPESCLLTSCLENCPQNQEAGYSSCLPPLIPDSEQPVSSIGKVACNDDGHIAVQIMDANSISNSSELECMAGAETSAEQGTVYCSLKENSVTQVISTADSNSFENGVNQLRNAVTSEVNNDQQVPTANCKVDEYMSHIHEDQHSCLNIPDQLVDGVTTVENGVFCTTEQTEESVCDEGKHGGGTIPMETKIVDVNKCCSGPQSTCDDMSGSKDASSKNDQMNCSSESMLHKTSGFVVLEDTVTRDGCHAAITSTMLEAETVNQDQLFHNGIWLKFLHFEKAPIGLLEPVSVNDDNSAVQYGPNMLINSGSRVESIRGVSPPQSFQKSLGPFSTSPMGSYHTASSSSGPGLEVTLPAWCHVPHPTSHPRRRVGLSRAVKGRSLHMKSVS